MEVTQEDIDCAICVINDSHNLSEAADHIRHYRTTALAAKEAELAAERVEAYTARHMREIAQGLGYPSILEALEDVSELRAEVEKLRVVVAGAYFEGFSDGPGNDDDAIACWQQSEARATLPETQP